MTISALSNTDNNQRNSYASSKEADDIVGIHPAYKVQWTALTETQRNDLLVFATQQIDNYNYVGTLLDENQSLKFPRTGLPEGYAQGDPTDDTNVPSQIVRATALFAGAWSVTNPSAGPSAVARGIQEVRAGSAQVKFRGRADTDAATAANSLQNVDSEAWALIRPLFASSETSSLRASTSTQPPNTDTPLDMTELA